MSRADELYKQTCRKILEEGFSDEGMPVVIISDGDLSDWGMRLCGMTEETLDRYLRRKRCTRQEVFLLTATKTGPHHLLTYADVKEGVG